MLYNIKTLFSWLYEVLNINPPSLPLLLNFPQTPNSQHLYLSS
jgi:hypothetical protein